MLFELLRGAESISMAKGMETVRSCTAELSCSLLVELRDELSFYPRGKYWIFHAADMNPREYSVATLQPFDLRDGDIIKPFGRLVQHQISERKRKTIEMPFMILLLDKGSSRGLYNEIYYALYDYSVKNKHR